jgi:hypothetical protein
LARFQKKARTGHIKIRMSLIKRIDYKSSAAKRRAYLDCSFKNLLLEGTGTLGQRSNCPENRDSLGKASQRCKDD